MRAAQHAIFGAQHFSPQAKTNVARLFCAGGEKRKEKKKVKPLFSKSPYVRENKNKIGPFSYLS